MESCLFQYFQSSLNCIPNPLIGGQFIINNKRYSKLCNESISKEIIPIKIMNNCTKKCKRNCFEEKYSIDIRTNVIKFWDTDLGIKISLKPHPLFIYTHYP